MAVGFVGQKDETGVTYTRRRGGNVLDQVAILGAGVANDLSTISTMVLKGEMMAKRGYPPKRHGNPCG